LRKTLAGMSRKREGQVQLEQWKAAVQASGIAELIAFVDGLADDAEAVANGCSLTWSNGMVEGFINKVKWIKRSSYGQAGFPLLQRRVRLASGSWVVAVCLSLHIVCPGKEMTYRKEAR
jgi:transposase